MPLNTRRRRAALASTTAALAAAAFAPASGHAAPAPTPGVSIAQPAGPLSPAPYYTLNWRPVFENYLACVPYQGKATVYTDFSDHNDDDASLVVTIGSAYNATGPMGVSDGYHGVFFWKAMNLPYAHTVLTFKATDPHGAVSSTWQAWLYHDGSCSAPWKA